VNLRRARQEEPSVDLTSMIDVVFILLLFFMVTTTFQRESELKIELPEASAEPVQQEDDVLEIVINTQGHYFIDQQEVVNTELQTLKKAIVKFLGERDSVPVVIRADRHTPYEAVVRAMDATSQLGLVQMSLATSQTQSGGD
jgi:biopolymer transport protein ExbD